jgi:acetylglutamate kinase
MIPKLEESFDALRAGVGAVHILSAQTERGLLAEVEQPGSVGTVLVA